MKIKKYYCVRWTYKEITSYEDLVAIRQLVAAGYDICSVDTETSGLHITLDKPFCISFAIVDLSKKQGKAFVIHKDRVPFYWLEFVETIILACKIVVFWNAKFDLHMLENIGLTKIKEHPGLTDAMIYARLANDALTPDKGGVTLDLKVYSTKMLDSDANVYEKEVSTYRRAVTIAQNNALKELNVKVGDIKEFLKDKINEVKDLPLPVQKILEDPKYNSNNYNNIPWDVLKRYAMFDVIFTIENYIRDYKRVVERKQLPVARREENIIIPLWKMERAGFALNKYYLKQAKFAMKQYIIERRQDLVALAGQELKVGQHALIKEIFQTKFGIYLEKSDEDALSKIHGGVAEEFAQTIIELRTLEKWYSTYICKWDSYSSKCDRIYTSFNQCGAVSGRFSSDFQQFPKEPIMKKDGTMLFSPRRIIAVSGGDYDEFCLIDYAAEELRIQALYTILINNPDVNLCRAFKPLNCTERDGKYYLNENPEEEWKPVDLHTLTTLKAFPNLKVTDPDFSHYRKIGKCTNFACNYNASKKALIEQFGYEEELADRLYNAYREVFPGIAKYREYVKNVLAEQDYITNLFDRRFYNCSWHNASNYLIQGSAADLLKIKILQLDQYLKVNNYKSRMLCLVHDEIIFEIHKDEHDIIYELKKIMEDVPNSPIPFVGEISLTTTTWDMKKGLK